MRGNVVIKVIPEDGVNPLGMLSPFTFALEIEDVVLKGGVQGGAVLCEDLHFEAFSDVMGVVVNMDILRTLVAVKTIEIDALMVVLADVVANDYIPSRPLHDAAEPQVVVAVVVLDIGIDAVVVGIKAPAITFPATVSVVLAADISVGLVILDFDPTGIKTENAMAGVASTAIGEDIVLVDRVLTGPSNDVISAGSIDVIAGDINLGPKVLEFFSILFQDHAAA